MSSPPAVPAPQGRPALLVLALLSLYLIWGSSYLGAKIALEGLPPLMVSGLRFYTAGTILLPIAVAAGYPLPTLREFASAALVGLFMMAIGNGALVISVQYVASGLVAVGMASIPMWTAIFAGILYRWPGRMEWLALAVGLGGIVLLNLQADFRGNPVGAAAILVGALAWALGTVLQQRLTIPQGLMAPAVEMVTAGIMLLCTSFLWGERLMTFPGSRPLLAVLYLAVGPSVIAFSSHAYLLRQRVRAVVANSFAYVNPVVAVVLGVTFGGETIHLHGLAAMAVIIVSLIMLGASRSKE